MLYLMQMSDFHFGGAGYSEREEEEILKKMAEKALNSIPADAPLALCLCGDFIDSKGLLPQQTMEAKKRYVRAQNVLRESVVIPLSKKHPLRIGMCVGNHDITHIDAMKSFAATLTAGSPDPFPVEKLNSSYAIHFDSDNLDLVFVNSCADGDYVRGSINYVALEDTLKGLERNSSKYLFLHHTIMSMDSRDSSSIYNTPELIRLLERYSIRAVFHGHIHGQYMLPVGERRCLLLGVGAVLSRNHADVNSQFHLLCSRNGYLVEGRSFQYHSDLARNPNGAAFSTQDLFPAELQNCFFGESFSEAYRELCGAVTARKKLYQVQLHVVSSFEAFDRDVSQNFGEKIELHTDDQAYSYYQLAQLWEQPKVDGDKLYFNHGMFFSTEQYPNGIDYVKQELRKKPTSSRAILSTVCSREISETTPDSFLPSLLSIQFGFDSNMRTLYITMNLRAWEISRFAKINICEILYFARDIRQSFPSVEKIDVVINAFRAQIKKNFGCFLKATLDKEKTQLKLSGYFSTFRQASQGCDETQTGYLSFLKKDVNQVLTLVREKHMRSETVIELTGLDRLKCAVLAAIEELNEQNPYLPQLKSIAAELSELLAAMQKLKDIRAEHSEPTSDMDSAEGQIDALFQSITKRLETILQE